MRFKVLVTWCFIGASHAVPNPLGYSCLVGNVPTAFPSAALIQYAKGMPSHKGSVLEKSDEKADSLGGPSTC